MNPSLLVAGGCHAFELARPVWCSRQGLNTTCDSRRPKQINEIKEFLQTARRPDARHVKIKAVKTEKGTVTKFKIRCSKVRCLDNTFSWGGALISSVRAVPVYSVCQGCRKGQQAEGISAPWLVCYIFYDLQASDLIMYLLAGLAKTDL